MSSELPHAAARVAILAALKARVNQAYEGARAEAAELLEPGDRKAARLGDGGLGHVLMTNGATRAGVSDETALLAWVKKCHPDEVVTTVRKSYLDKLLRDAKRHGAPVDETTGELVPGIVVSTGDPYISVRLAEDAGQVITANWPEAHRHVPELPG